MKTTAVFGAIAIGVVMQARIPADRYNAVQRNTTPFDGFATIDISGGGRFVAFESSAPLSPVDTNKTLDVYVLDLSSNRITLESVSRDGHSANGQSTHPRLNADGRYLVFESLATNIGGQASRHGVPQVFLRDRATGVTILVSRAPADTAGTKGSMAPDLSDDGRVVVFESGAPDLDAGPDLNGDESDIYLFDVASRALERISVDSEGMQPAAGWSGSPRISGDGLFVAFASRARLDPAMVREPAAREVDRPKYVFLRDLRARTTRLVSRTVEGRAPHGSSASPAISADGRFVAFASTATELTPRDRNGTADVFLQDMVSGRTVLVSRSAVGSTANGRSGHPAISGDGRYVAFASDASDLLCARRCPQPLLDLNLVSDVYLFDALTGDVARVSGDGPTDEPWWEASGGPSLDAAGGMVAFSSRHPIDAGDLGADYDLFVQPTGKRAPSRKTAGETRSSPRPGRPLMPTSTSSIHP